jgi:hypothetical protein
VSNTQWGIALVVVLLFGVLRLWIAPRVAARWPGSWLDQLVAFVLRAGVDIFGAMVGAMLRQGTGGALVPTSDDRELAKRTYETYATAVSWTTHTGKPMLSWEALPEDTKAGWITAATAIHSGAKKFPSTRPPPLPILFMLVLCGCAGTTDIQQLTKSVSDLDPVLHAAYRADRERCAGQDQCLATVDKAWKPIEDLMVQIHDIWCHISMSAEGCK